ncbi:MAG: BA14K family protein, partial [Hyphomicrobiales bacterium]|nr:BA14K family protein [Hyphomicrobiales bacterium]
AAFGFIQPLNDLLPTRMADFLSGLSGELNAGLVEGSNASAEFGVASATTASGPRPVSSNQQMASAAVARPVSTTTVRADVQPSANSGVSGLGEQTALLGATNQKAFELGATVLELGAINSAEFATSKSELALEEAPPAAAPAPPPVATAAAPRVAAPVAAAADQGSVETPAKPALQQAAKADSVQVANVPPPAITPAPIVTAAPPVLSPLSPAQIERLLARGTELLQSGDIASARLLFLRVAETGDRRGAKGVGMTYDPRIYARLPVTGLTPDREQAEIWYKKAGDVSLMTIDGNTAAGTPDALEAGSAQWNAACARKYSSFEPGTGLFTANSGAKRRCKLP